MPVVDLEDILGAIDGKQEAPKISLTLFQAIMFAGTAFVDLQLLLNAGYNDRRSARGDYFQKVKLLYDFDWDVDRIPLIQSLLLGNYWIISASMRRPMRLKDEEINLSPLTLHDFETQLIATDIPALRDCPFITDTAIRKNLAQICTANIGICLCIGRIMKSLYQLRVFGGSTAEATMLYKPRMSQINPEQVSILQDDLDHWCKDLPNSCLLLSTASSNLHNKFTEDVLFLHKAFLQMTYLMAVETLNRPQVLLGKPSTAPASKANSAIEKIAETTQWLQERNLIKFLQPLAVSFMLFSLASFLVDIKTKGKELQDLPSRQFHTCIRALWQLRETWPIADSASFLVGQMISKSQVDGLSTPVILPALMSSSDLSAMPQPTEKDLSVKHAVSFQYPNVNHLDESASYPPLDMPTTIHPQPQTDLTRMSATAPGQVVDPVNFDPSSFAWQDFTGSEIDNPFSSIIQGQALQMDFAFQEFEGLGDFQNNFLGFGPSPTDDFDPQAPDMSYPSSGQVQTSLAADWNQDPALQSTYIDPSFRSSRQG
ncbi:hypothetical protein LTR10_022749 [Elasticomyces elasticus]|uniref:Transcription factor domain-containing protein n=1 Tax=Exophiala sideris TaxID=1016849 RepID=A0ABR0J9Y4_9EURO|nr:hypothetical protein LTR10_022749 [Elasticomyces elasticus]KAK5026137.1 hypothetical protein LTS07_007662 [Exophiala sideris]KAK5032391.1 hypothetical protein LTR13_007214 [Exophiala sideris]KAK5059547.1 hypothetical protein LTR69_006136 [Exophiala sideris]KAK5186709.1 hypothetical protein LTR44_000715 [Eurotiomycetes sp. CCFEE 6388]